MVERAVHSATGPGTHRRRRQANRVVRDALSPDAQAFISKKISILRHEGAPQNQATAMAHSYARRRGFDVPDRRA